MSLTPASLPELILPALRWNPTTLTYNCEGIDLDAAIEIGVGGFCLFGGEARAAEKLIAELNERSRVPLLIASDLERGAGQQLDGLTGLPPLAGLASLGDPAVMRRAGALTAREARAAGINWIFAPVLDLDIEPLNPIIGTRAIGSDPDTVAELGVAWIEGCQTAGALACAKHFPGHGRTTADSHATLASVDAGRSELQEADFVPFRHAIAAGVAAIMTAHVAFPALDASGDPATLSRAILRGLLRGDLGYEGLVVTDAMIMEGVRSGAGEGVIACRALNAGADLLLYPQNVEAVAGGIRDALAREAIAAEPLRQSLERRTAFATRAALHVAAADAGATLADDRQWAREIGQRVIHVLRGSRPTPARRIRLRIVDDDIGGPYLPPSREPLVKALAASGFEVDLLGDDSHASTDDGLLIALFGDIRAWKGRPGYSSAAIEAVRAAAASSPASTVIQFSHPRLAADLDAPNVICAWGGDASMQESAARYLAL